MEPVERAPRLQRNHNSLDLRWLRWGFDNEGHAAEQAAPFKPPLAPKWLFHFSNNHTAAAVNERADYRRRGSRGETKSSDYENKVVIFSALIKSLLRLKAWFECVRRKNTIVGKISINMLMCARFSITYMNSRSGGLKGLVLPVYNQTLFVQLSCRWVQINLITRL